MLISLVSRKQVFIVGCGPWTESDTYGCLIVMKPITGPPAVQQDFRVTISSPGTTAATHTPTELAMILENGHILDRFQTAVLMIIFIHHNNGSSKKRI